MSLYWCLNQGPHPSAAYVMNLVLCREIDHWALPQIVQQMVHARIKSSQHCRGSESGGGIGTTT